MNAEVVKTVAGSIVESIKAQPVPTIVVTLNFAVLAMVYLGVQKQADRYERHLDKVMERCLPAGDK